MITARRAEAPALLGSTLGSFCYATTDIIVYFGSTKLPAQVSLDPEARGVAVAACEDSWWSCGVEMIRPPQPPPSKAENGIDPGR